MDSGIAGLQLTPVAVCTLLTTRPEDTLIFWRKIKDKSYTIRAQRANNQQHKLIKKLYQDHCEPP
jgi:hypothetical protein